MFYTVNAKVSLASVPSGSPVRPDARRTDLNDPLAEVVLFSQGESQEWAIVLAAAGVLVFGYRGEYALAQVCAAR